MGNVPAGSSIPFSMQASTVIYEHVKRISRFLKCEYALRYNAFSLLLSMLEVGRPVSVAELVDYLMLSRNTVLPLLLDAEDRGFVSKADDETDARYMMCALTDSGEAFVREACRGVSTMLQETFLSALPASEFELFSMIDRGLVNLRGHDVPGFGLDARNGAGRNEEGEFFSSGYFVEWRVLVDQWKRILRDGCGLSFDEYRILDVLSGRGSMMLSDVAAYLCLQKSGLSLYKDNLIRLGLVMQRVDPFDARRMVLRCTPKGVRVAASARDELDAVTQKAHCGLSESGEVVLAAWYTRMHSNLRLSSRK